MTKINLKFVQSFGGYHYFRRRGLRVRLPGIPGSAEFMQKYQETLARNTTTPTDIGASTRSKPAASARPLPNITARKPSALLVVARLQNGGPTSNDSARSMDAYRWHRCRRNLSSRCSTPCNHMPHSIG